MSRGAEEEEIVRQILIDAAPATVFALLTDSRQMAKWLANFVAADSQPGGVFRISEPGGMSIEGNYVEIIPNRKVVFTWGGIENLRPGESTVEFTLVADGSGTLLTLRHYGLPRPAIKPHDLGWLHSGLPKLKAAAEGRDPGGLCLGDLAHR